MVTVFCKLIGKYFLHGAVILLTFTEKCTIIISQDDFIQISVLIIYSIIQTSVNVNRYSQIIYRFLYIREKSQLEEEKYV